MSNSEESKGSFKVEDKRRFDADGSERGESGITSGSQNFERSEPNAHELPIDFSSFIVSLATQGMMQLGEIPTPDGVHMPQDIGLAKQTIDILTMLHEKTKGNLDEFESQLFQEVLHNIRMAYVKKTKV